MDFSNIGDLTGLYSDCPVVAMTATAPKDVQDEIVKSLHMKRYITICTNPDRSNIHYTICKRKANRYQYDSYEEIVEPLATELHEKKQDFPLTIVYFRSLEWCGESYSICEDVLGNEQFYDKDVGRSSVTNRCFAQFHSKITSESKEEIVRDMTKENPKIRLILATVALGMGINAPGVRRVIHIRPPTTLMAYFQETGRGGRDGAEAEAILYYNNDDISTATNVSSSVREYCQSDSTCLRKLLLMYFGYEIATTNSRCCSVCDD